MSAPQQTIDGRTFSFGMMPAETSFLVSLRIVKQIGETAFRLIVAFASQDGDITTKEGLMLLFQQIKGDPEAIEKLTKGMMTALQTADPAEYLAIVKTVFASVTAEREIGKGNASHAPLDGLFGVVFAGKPKLVWKVLLPALRENYRDFFDTAGTPSSPPSTT